ncbi:BON domain-containing protein [Phenylobacterium sp. LjRoot225]|uniref:BON domain-containing protein n=1 Tax=Phenylobacterium sp. LjRoot225 TaxID=3342285 RepID=UPI003ED14A9B
MSDWHRRDRDDDQERRDAERRDRRDFEGRDTWRGRDDEQRSFDLRQPDPARGGYSGQSFGGPDFSRPNRSYGERAYGGQPYGQSYGGQSYGGQSYGGRPYRGEDMEGRRYGGGRNAADQGVGGQRYEADRARYGQDRGAVGTNPSLQRVSDGDADQGWRADMGAGEHRGRGPKNYTRSDARITEDVNDRLSDDSWLDASEIEVRVASGEVTLTGAVQSREDRRRAEDLVEQVGGVKHVQNNLRIEAQPTQSGRNMPLPPVT